MAAVFFIIGIICFSACGADKEKIKPDMPKDNRNAIVAENENYKENNIDRPKQNITETGDKPGEKKITDTPPEGGEPRVDITEGALRNRDKKWTAAFDNGEILDALYKLDVRVATVGAIEVGQTNNQECATTISIGGRYLSAFDFKEALGLKSTKITEIRRDNNEYIFTGFGEN